MLLPFLPCGWLQWSESLWCPPSPMEVTCRGMFTGGCPPWAAGSHLGRRKLCWRRKSLCWEESPSSSGPSSEQGSSSLLRACSRTQAAWACPWSSGPYAGSCHCLVSAAACFPGVCLGSAAVSSPGEQRFISREEWMNGTGHSRFSDLGRRYANYSNTVSTVGRLLNSLKLLLVGCVRFYTDYFSDFPLWQWTLRLTLMTQ